MVEGMASQSWLLLAWLGCAVIGVPSLGCPGGDTLPGVGGGCCPLVDVEAGNGCCPLGCSNIDWA